MGGQRTFFLFISITHFFAINAEVTPRNALEIIIGGSYSPPSPPPSYEIGAPPPSCPPPLPPPPPPSCPPPLPPPPPPPPSFPPPPPPPPPPPSPHLPPSPPPPPSPHLPPSPPKHHPPSPRQPFGGFESMLLAKYYRVIQKFKKKVQSCDPKNTTGTWTGKNICRDYKGFKCDIVPDLNMKTISGVNFNNRNFNCPNLTLDILLGVGGLNDLAFFHANSNNFTGSIPSNIGKLRYLYELDLSNNKFTGNFPSEVLRANNLVFLDLRFNTFSGVVPPQVFILDLDLLFINNNNLMQTLPDNLGSSPVLYLTLANNQFVGRIPPSIALANKTLLEVLFLNNQLSGCLPYEIGFLKKSTVFDVGGNRLTGPIPHSFQCLEKMELLNLAHNQFYFDVPEAVCCLPELSNFTVSYNYFTEVGPKCRELIKKGVLDVKMNCILGLPNQRSPADCNRFFSKKPSCPNKKSFTYVPCSKGYSGNQLESSELQWGSPSRAPAPVSLGRSYGALSPH